MRKRSIFLRLAPLVAVAIPVMATPGMAHDPGLSSSKVTVERDTIAIDVTFDGDDVADLTTDLERFARRALRLESAVDTATFSLIAADEADDVAFRLRFERPVDAQVAFTLAVFSDLPRGHRHYVSVVDRNGSIRADALLSETRATFATTLAESDRDSGTIAQRFFELGWEHILIGYDHLLFLIVLLLGASRIGSAAAIITSFTVAHSITLALASLDVVRLPGVVVEAVIAASIVYVAIDNLRSGTTGHRWRLTFAFGLVHGFGFASVLSELGLADAGGIALPLLSFNVGVEAGQLAVAALAWPALLLLRRRAHLQRQTFVFGSCAVALVGGWWLVERTLLG